MPHVQDPALSANPSQASRARCCSPPSPPEQQLVPELDFLAQMCRDLAVPEHVGCEKQCLTMMTKSCVIVGKTTDPTSWQPHSALLDRLLHRLCACVHLAAMSVWFYVISGNRHASTLHFCEVQHLGKA